MKAATSVQSGCDGLVAEVRLLPGKPKGLQFDVLHTLVSDVSSDSLGSSVAFYWVTVGGVPVLVPATDRFVAVNAPSESQNHSIELPPVIAGILVAVFALEYGVFTDSGTRRGGLAATILTMKYQYIHLLRVWAEAQLELGAEVLGIIE